MLMLIGTSILAPAGLMLALLISVPADAGSYSTDARDGKVNRFSVSDVQLVDNRHRNRDDHDGRDRDRRNRDWRGHGGGHGFDYHRGHGNRIVVIRPAPRVLYYRNVHPQHGYYADPGASFLGAFAGAIVGGIIGNSMDRSDHVHAIHVLETGRTGYRSAWRNPESGFDYAIVPTRTYQADDGQYCREYTTWGRIGGRDEQLYGHACRMPDGSWRIAG